MKDLGHTTALWTGRRLSAIPQPQRVYGDGLHEQEERTRFRYSRQGVRAVKSGDVQVWITTVMCLAAGCSLQAA